MMSVKVFLRGKSGFSLRIMSNKVHIKIKNYYFCFCKTSKFETVLFILNFLIQNNIKCPEKAFEFPANSTTFTAKWYTRLLEKIFSDKNFNEGSQIRKKWINFSRLMLTDELGVLTCPKSCPLPLNFCGVISEESEID